MPHSAMDLIRERLESARRRQNLNLLLTCVGLWLTGSLLLFLVAATVGNLFNLNSGAWRWISLGWVAAVVVLAVIIGWRLIAGWQGRRRFVHALEQRLPEFEQRLITSVELDKGETSGVSRQFLNRLLEDVQQRVEARPVTNLVSLRTATRTLALAAVFTAGAAALLGISDDFRQAGRQLTWWWQVPGAQDDPATAPLALRVEPGNTAMQRGDDMNVIVSLENASGISTPGQLVLHVRDNEGNREQFNMARERGQPVHSPRVFAARLRQLGRELEYYVEYRAGNDAAGKVIRSPRYRVELFDLPRVESLELAYEFPEYTGMKPKVENPGGDVVAPQGTQVNLTATLNKPAKEAELVFGNGESVPLEVEGRRASGRFQVTGDGEYRIQLADQRARRNREPRKHTIRAIPDRPPEISLRAPGRDREVMPLEEVAIRVQAEDDYQLSQLQLTYSALGGEEKTVDLLAEADNRHDVSAGTLVYLEDLELAPGDVVSYSVTAADNNGLSGPARVVSDIYFLEVIPTDHEFRRSRAAGTLGGGAGGGGDANALVTIQKDVIAATWKLRNRQADGDSQSLAGDGQIIRDSQADVVRRTRMSIDRLTERGAYAQDNYQRAVEALWTAIEQMEVALDSLDNLALAPALEAEQRALGAILRAESQVNRTEVAVNRNGGSGGSPDREREDLRELFEMEMGELENRYELPQQAGIPDQPHNETLDKLRELARRQEQLTRSQRELAHRQDQLEKEHERRQLEQLRREQEELRQQLAELSKAMGGATGQGSSGGQPSDSSPGSGEERQRMRQLQQAMEQMRQAERSDTPGQAAAKGQKALDSLRRQTERMETGGEQSLADLQQAVKQNSEQLLERQRGLRRTVEEKSRSQSLQAGDSANTRDLLEQREELRQSLDEMGRQLREIASRAGDEQQQLIREAGSLARALRPIQDKMSTGQQILERGMLNLSVRVENDIESELAKLQQRIRNLGGQTAPAADRQPEQVAKQVQQLRQSLQGLQQQLQQQTGRGDPSGQPVTEEGQPGNGGVSSNGDGTSRQVNRGDLQQSLERSRKLARELARLGLGGKPWAGSARSIRSQLTEQDLEAFLRRPELLEQLLAPLVELEERLLAEAQLNQIDDKLYSSLNEQVPEQYRPLVESYYKMLSETKTARSGPR